MNWFKRKRIVRAAAHDLPALKYRLAGLSADDALWPLLLGLADQWTKDAVEACVLPGLDDAEAHRLRGRVAMMLDFRESLAALWNETHPKPKEPEPPAADQPERMT